ncbi:MAG: hypothetical protein ACREML_01445 [Vulcanimicrobiaceae bacterium]
MALRELETKEALRIAADWLFVSDLPGAPAAREGIANVIPLVMMGEITPRDFDDLAAIVEDQGQSMRQEGVTPEQLQAAVKAAFEQVKAPAAPPQE